MQKIILLAEDNFDDEALAVEAIGRNGNSAVVAVAHDGAEAVRYLFPKDDRGVRNLNELPALILLDLSLPKLDGHDLLQLIRSDARTRRIPVVIFSNSDDERDLQDSYDLGVNSYVAKPTNAAEFSETVRAIASYWLFTNRPAPR